MLGCKGFIQHLLLPLSHKENRGNLKGEFGSVSQMQQDPFFFFKFKVPLKFKASHGDISILAVY